MDTAQLGAVAEVLEADELADMLRQLPGAIINQLMGTSIAVIGLTRVWTLLPGKSCQASDEC